MERIRFPAAVFLVLLSALGGGRQVAARSLPAALLPAFRLTATPSPTPGIAPFDPAGGRIPAGLTAILPDNAEAVRQVAQWGKGYFHSLHWSPDGRFLAAGSQIGISFADTQTLAEVKFIATGNLYPASLKNPLQSVFSADGSRLAAGFDDWTVRIYAVPDGTLLQTLKGHTGSVSSLAYSPDGKLLATGSADTTIKLWRASDGKMLRTLTGHQGTVQQIVFSPDGKTLAADSWEAIRIWRVSDGKLLRTTDQKIFGSASNLAFSPDGENFAVSDDRTITIRRMSDGNIRQTLSENARVNGLAFSPDGKLLAAATLDGGSIWRAADGRQMLALNGVPPSGIRLPAFSPDGGLLAATSAGGDIGVWQVVDGNPVRMQSESIGLPADLDFSPDGTLLAVGTTAGTVQIRSLADGALKRTLQGHANEILAVAFSPDGQRILSDAYKDPAVKIWRTADGALERTLSGHTDAVNDAAFSPDGSTIATASDDKTVKLWSVADGALLRSLPEVAHALAVAFSPDGNLLASLSADGQIQIWRLSDGTRLQTLMAGEKSSLPALKFSPDGAWLAEGGWNLKVWSSADWQLRINSWADANTLSAIVFTKDSKQVITASADGEVRIRRLPDGKTVNTLQGHISPVRALALSPDGALLASGGYDYLIRFWGTPGTG